MLPIVRTYINKHQLLEKERLVIVGLSGGADSVALLSVLVQLGYHCLAAHCNFHLRGDESDRDEAFARQFVHTLNVSFYAKDFDTLKYASEHHLSTEMAARELRYGWFEKLRQETDAQAIAVAHHRDDQAETVLMNLMRGSGIHGMRGIRPQNDYIVRPLLAVGREEILAWLKGEGLTYVTDSTNLSDVYMRNFIRLRILPLMEKLNPSAKQAIARTATQLSSVEAIYQSVIEKAKAKVITDNNRLSINELLLYPSPETILYELLLPFQFTRQVAEDIFLALENESGKIFYSSTHRLVKDRDSLLLSPLESENQPDGCLITELEGEIVYGNSKLSFRKVAVDVDFRLQMAMDTAYIDFDKLCFPLLLRTWQAGDWFIPFGMKGRKKLSDYFIDQKYSLLAKEQALLLCSSEEIVWVVGQRVDDRFKIEKSTKNALIIKFSHNI
ncbi:tRNA(Ile)-lysidine synthase [Bacteroidia bacterium]|nr:tRNA(Ile)-lysidine synthase [Bacteroidia bacterium]